MWGSEGMVGMRLLYVLVERLCPSRWMPCGGMYGGWDLSLGKSLLEDGLLLPLVVRPLWTALKDGEGETTFMPPWSGGPDFPGVPSDVVDGKAMTEDEWIGLIAQGPRGTGLTCEEERTVVDALRWEIIDGEQRWRALREAGDRRVPVAVHPCSDDTAGRLREMLNKGG